MADMDNDSIFGGTPPAQDVEMQDLDLSITPKLVPNPKNFQTSFDQLLILEGQCSRPFSNFWVLWVPCF